ncbi:urease accessory protein UreD [Staphylococcus capitis]|uniref:urease accessory protein UreD n=1 Tax=Staphylococcus capitis TaxID=29388 RepID=UPI0001928CAD|nr:urease accessory protein UreD [Staphylococcus capitis]MBW4837699.1 urease accessory protein UreD [Staphylococcaceae bacterium]EEE50075.1 urease accessory protein UreD [Staphylococcus capitis SK14]EGS40701.1 urease accessory protein UreD [Staphylococcus capitis VCU116]MBN6785717.1 urease accessory protein UreD [Staphylococcus capitis]MBW4843811.1 urease accessory protein UreD [Staphylococcaceae bacterium]
MAQSKWTGELDLTVFNNGHRSVARNIFFEKALKVLRPVYLNQSTIPTFYIVNVGGGYLDGDRYRLNINLEENAQVTLTSQGATKIYKTLNDRVEQYQSFNLANHSYMEFVADPIIAYENAKFYQHNTFRLEAESSMFYTDILTPGYSSDDHDFTYKYMHLINEIYVEDELVTYDNMLLNPEKNQLSSIGYMEDYTHLGSAYFIHPEVNQNLIDDIYKQVSHYENELNCRLGITQLPTHGLAIRILANRTQTIEKILTKVQSYIAQVLYQREIDFLRKY